MDKNTNEIKYSIKPFLNIFPLIFQNGNIEFYESISER